MSTPTREAVSTGHAVWGGQWVADALGIRVHTTSSPIGIQLHELVGLAVRRNPRRAHLLVSTVLGKHVPTDPDLVYGTGRLLGELAAGALSGGPTRLHGSAGKLVRAALAGDVGAGRALLEHVDASRDRRATRERDRVSASAGADAGAVVLGYAETATALGHAVADALETPYLHSTRRPVTGCNPVGGFEEEHSHATSHLLLPEDAALLAGSGPLVLVDDELSTGTTALNTIAALHARHPRGRYVIAALVDLRSEQDQDRMRQFGQQLGVRVDVVALAAGHVELPPDVLTRGQAHVAATEASAPVQPAAYTEALDGHRPPSHQVAVHWPTGVKEGGRHGFTRQDREGLEAAVAGLAHQVQPLLPMTGRVHVLGFEELMYAPLRLAQQLAAPERIAVTYSTTTRSPVLPVDDAGYAIRSRLTFPEHDNPADGPGPRFAYNLLAPADAEPRGPRRRFDLLLLVVDAAADTDNLHRPGGLLDQLTLAAPRVALITLPDYRPSNQRAIAGQPSTVDTEAS